MARQGHLRVAFFLALCFSQAATAAQIETQPKPGPRAYPVGNAPMVGDAPTAITIAHAMWQSVSRPDHIPSEEEWQKHFTATLHDGVWWVTGDTGGTFYISQHDGRYLGTDILMGQIIQR